MIIVGIIIFAVLGFIFGCCTAISCGADESIVTDSLFGALLGLLVGTTITVILGAIAAGIPGEQEEVVIKTTPIYAFQDNLNIEGHRTLMSGYIDETLCYYYVYQTAGGGYKVGHVNQDDTTIYYVTNEEDCRKETREVHFKNPIHDWLAEDYIDTTYAFYIPEGSIITEYNVDLQ